MTRTIATLALLASTVASVHSKSIDYVATWPNWIMDDMPTTLPIMRRSPFTLENNNRDIKTSGVVILSGSKEIRIMTTTTGTLVIRLVGDGEE